MAWFTRRLGGIRAQFSPLARAWLATWPCSIKREASLVPTRCLWRRRAAYKFQTQLLPFSIPVFFHSVRQTSKPMPASTRVSLSAGVCIACIPIVFIDLLTLRSRFRLCSLNCHRHRPQLPPLLANQIHTDREAGGSVKDQRKRLPCCIVRTASACPPRCPRAARGVSQRERVPQIFYR